MLFEIINKWTGGLHVLELLDPGMAARLCLASMIKCVSICNILCKRQMRSLPTLAPVPSQRKAPKNIVFF